MLQTSFQACFQLKGNGTFWEFLSLSPLEGESKLLLRLGALKPDAAAGDPSGLQVNLFNSWMDKFRTANPEIVNSALATIPPTLYDASHLRTGLTCFRFPLL